MKSSFIVLVTYVAVCAISSAHAQIIEDKTGLRFTKDSGPHQGKIRFKSFKNLANS